MNRARPFVFYVMACNGRLYAGTHQVRARSCWRPSKGERGNGALPDGYAGSGKKWRAVVHKYGVENVRWRLVAVIHAPVRDDIDAMERRVIGVARRLFGKACCNLREGTVMTSADALVINNRPEVKAKISAALKIAMNRPEVKAKKSAAQNRSDVVAKISAANRIRFNVPPAPEHIYNALVDALRQGKGDDIYQAFIARLALQFPSIPVWQFMDACIEAGIPKDQGDINVKRALLVAKLHAEITPASQSEQSPKALAGYMRVLADCDVSQTEASIRAALRYPTIDGPAGGRAAAAVGFKRGVVRSLINHVHAIVGVIEEQASQKAA